MLIVNLLIYNYTYINGDKEPTIDISRLLLFLEDIMK